jgi:peptidoglycan-N-acetylglucosamine deacetylase
MSEILKTRAIVTTSWDDGDQTDLKLAELLQSGGIRGTFYVPIKSYRKCVLNRGELKSLSEAGFEIGGHGFSHKLLWRLSTEELAAEIVPCRPMLEDIVGARVRMFCYPCGRYDASAIRAVRKAGYYGARTVRMLATRMNFKAFEMPTTVQAFPHSRLTYLRNIARGRKLEGLQAYLAHRAELVNWVELGKRLFDEVWQNGGIWHLYGHSWEIEELGLWPELKQILDYVGAREGVTYVTNGQLLAALSVQPEN